MQFYRRSVGQSGDKIGDDTGFLFPAVLRIGKIYVFRFCESFEQTVLRCLYGVPTHMRNLVLMLLWLELEYWNIKYAQTVSAALLATAAHELLAETDAQDGLPQIFYYAVKTMRTQVFHCGAGLAYARKYYLVGSMQLLFIIGQKGIDAKSVQCAYYRAYVSGIVFDYCNIHLEWDLFQTAKL